MADGRSAPLDARPAGRTDIRNADPRQNGSIDARVRDMGRPIPFPNYRTLRSAGAAYPDHPAQPYESQDTETQTDFKGKTVPVEPGRPIESRPEIERVPPCYDYSF